MPSSRIPLPKHLINKHDIKSPDFVPENSQQKQSHQAHISVKSRLNNKNGSNDGVAVSKEKIALVNSFSSNTSPGGTYTSSDDLSSNSDVSPKLFKSFSKGPFSSPEYNSSPTYSKSHHQVVPVGTKYGAVNQKYSSSLHHNQQWWMNDSYVLQPSLSDSKISLGDTGNVAATYNGNHGGSAARAVPDGSPVIGQVWSDRGVPHGSGGRKSSRPKYPTEGTAASHQIHHPPNQQNQKSPSKIPTYSDINSSLNSRRGSDSSIKYSPEKLSQNNQIYRQSTNKIKQELLLSREPLSVCTDLGHNIANKKMKSGIPSPTKYTAQKSPVKCDLNSTRGRSSSVEQSPCRIPVATDHTGHGGSKWSVGSDSSNSRISPRHSPQKETSPGRGFSNIPSPSRIQNSSHAGTPTEGLSPKRTVGQIKSKHVAVSNSENFQVKMEDELNVSSKQPLQLALDLGSTPKERDSNRSPEKSKIPSFQQAHSKSNFKIVEKDGKNMIPEVCWSISRQDVDGNGKNSELAQNGQKQVRNVKLSPEKLPEILQDHGSPSENISTDSFIIKRDPPKKKRSYEAFVMTGDVMINLAKTPAHEEFRSKYRNRPELFEVGKQNSTSLPSSPVENDGDHEAVPEVGATKVKLREQPHTRRSLVRTSKSEDQLQFKNDGSLGIVDVDYEDDVTSSLNTLLDTNEFNRGKTPEDVLERDVLHWKQPVSSDSSSSKNSIYNDNSEKTFSPTSEKAVSDPTSPDFSTSSLISSEHYNGESLLDQMSPPTSTSPDTPEWSLVNDLTSSHHSNASGKNNLDGILASDGTSGSKERGSRKSKKEKRSSIVHEDNRCIITIGANSGNPRQSAEEGSGGTSLTEDLGSAISLRTVIGDEEARHTNEDNHVKESQSRDVKGEFTTGGPSEEEESDLDSLHSYQPPVKIVDIPSAVRLAKRLYNLEGFKKSDVSRHLSKNNDFNRAVAEEYLKNFDFGGDTLDVALRKFLRQFCLTGETQERERVLVHFSRRYLDCNAGILNSQDAVHTLTCAIMLLNTDLHGENLGRRMTAQEFIENLCELNDGEDFPKDILNNIYTALKREPIEWAIDEDCVPDGAQFQDKKQDMTAQNDVAISGFSSNPFLDVPDPDDAVDYKKGYVMRKCCVDANGKKTPLGKRGWKMYYMTLRNMVLYLHKDEKSVSGSRAFDGVHNAIRVHHALAAKADDYVKKQNVFRLYTCDLAECLFQTCDDKELRLWIDAVNLAAASLSAPPLPAPVGSRQKFQRPLLPCSKSKFSLPLQLSEHENRIRLLQEELDEHRDDFPLEKGTKNSLFHYYKEKEKFLLEEIARYKVYVSILSDKLHSN